MNTFQLLPFRDNALPFPVHPSVKSVTFGFSCGVGGEKGVGEASDIDCGSSNKLMKLV